MASDFSICSVFILLLLTHWVDSEPTRDKQALLDFLSKAPHAFRVQWNSSNSVCNWTGVECDSNRSFVFSLRLSGVGLLGPIPANTIGKLIQLRVLSLPSNRLSGEIPSDFSNLVMLRNLYLQDNAFSGEFPSSFTQLTGLTRLDLSSNNFSGPIPAAVDNLTHLNGLFLQSNSFSGSIPSISAVNLTNFNVSNNKLNGSIPNSLAKFPASSFAGNLNLCNKQMSSCNSSIRNSMAVTARKSKKLSTAAINGIIVGAVIATGFPLFYFLNWCHDRPQKERNRSRVRAATRAKPAAAKGGTSSSKDDITGRSVERNKLVFFKGGAYKFEMEDLLNASAEVLGKGGVWTSYKAVLEEGTAVVVKRLKDVVLTEKEFHMQMEVLGNIEHQNVAPIRAFYFSKKEKLLLYDYISTGSLSANLHGSRGSGNIGLNWDSRMKIALSMSRGLAHLHLAGVVHGNIKSSNILLRPDNVACLSDFAFNLLTNHLAGYQAPEILHTQKATFKSDVYSYGVLLLELLTGKAPNQQSLGEDDIDLPRWAQSVILKNWRVEVFDAELMQFHEIEVEMVELLQIAISCVSTIPDQRPPMSEVVQMIEDLNRSREIDEPFKCSDVNMPPLESTL